MNNLNKKFILKERTAKFGENIIHFCKTIPKNTITNPLISQVVCSGTSIGANYMEANGAVSKKDFKNKISLYKKESMETKHWLKMIAVNLNDKNKAKILWREAHELILIFSKIISSLKNNNLIKINNY